jgi:drug/metabolite transporter (DMT)-like permease
LRSSLAEALPVQTDAVEPATRDGAPGPQPTGPAGRVDRARLVGIALVVGAAIGYGSGGLFARPTYEAGADWLTVMAWRFGIAMGLSWLVVATRPRARAAVRALAPRALAVTLALGAMLVLHSGTYYAALETVPVSLAGLITAIYPPAVAVLAVWIGRPLEGRRAWIALALTVIGMVLAVGGIETSHMPPWTGIALAISAPLFYAVWIVLAARHSGETREATGAESEHATDAVATGAILLTGTAGAYWIMALAIRHPVLPWDVPSAAWPGIIGVAVSAGFIAPQAFYAGAKRIGGAQAALVSTVEPLYTILAAGLILGEVLTITQWAGAALIISGVVLSQSRGRGPKLAAAEADEPVLPQPLARVSDD